MSTTIYVKISLKFNALKVDKIDIRTCLKQKKTKGLTLKPFSNISEKSSKDAGKLFVFFTTLVFHFNVQKSLTLKLNLRNDLLLKTII